uniref:CHK kinase-like domain-containing protein n=1 Tax=Stomoxys calcitrans TaxID=35570 RepID=A0A1I8PNS0_STOCA
MNSDQQPNGGGEAPAPPALPAWIEPSVFESVIRDKFPDFKQIKDFKAIPALGAGENYATVMLRLIIEVELRDGSSKNMSYMLKTAHDSVYFRQMMQFHNVFAVESDVYREVLPEFEEMYREAGVEIKFGANSYDLTVEEPYILLEDLATRGFKNMNRLEGLDMEHVHAVLSKMAQWHAASAVRVANKGPYKQSLSSGFMKEGAREMMKAMFDGMFKIFLQCAKSFEGSEEYYETMNANSDKLVDDFIKLAEQEKKEFCVLNHGDCWSNNVMFQHDAFGKVKETYFVDFQGPRYGSPAQDLYYFLLSSAKYEIKIKNFDHFIKFYHDCLVRNLTLLNYSQKVPTLRDLHILLYKSGLWGYSTVTGVMGAVLLDPNENAQMENFFADTDAGQLFRFQMYSGARYRKHAEMLLPWLYNRGAF